MFKDLRKKVNRDTSKARSTYFTQLIEQAKGNSKEMWNHLKKIFPSKSNDKSFGPDVLMRDGVSITEAKAKANCLNEFFTSIWRTLAARFAHWQHVLIPLLLASPHRDRQLVHQFFSFKIAIKTLF